MTELRKLLAREPMDATKLSSGQHCLRFMVLVHVLGYGDRSSALDFGIAVHNVLEEGDRALLAGGDTESAQAAALLEALKQIRLERTEEGEVGPRGPKAHKRSRQSLMRIAAWYYEWWKNDLPKTRAIEMHFSMDFEGRTLWGYLDAFLEDRLGPWIRDKKTTSMGVGNPEMYQNSVQFSGYFLKGLELEPKLRGIMVDEIGLAGTQNRFNRVPVRVNVEGAKRALRDAFGGLVPLEHIATPLVPSTVEALQTPLEERHKVEVPKAPELWEIPGNRSSCWKYGKCRFFDVCGAKSDASAQAELGTIGRNPVWNPTVERS